jgi:predicted TIM-barrel fold metal-dependent hydrolase
MITYKNKFGKRLMVSGGECFMKRIVLVVFALTITLHPATFSQTTVNSQQPIVPAADYHAHISSIEVSRSMLPPLQPVIQLPEDLARLIRERESYAERDVSGLYTKDALIFFAGPMAWMRGRENAKGILQDFRPGLRYLPVEYKIDGSAGFIAGYIRLGDNPGRLARHFLFVLRREDGEWRIASDIASEGPQTPKAQTAEEYIEELNTAGIKRGVILSTAFIFDGGAEISKPDEYEKVKAENNWVAEQVARFPDRFVGFCSFNPLRDHALTELSRCAKMPQIKGLKLHFENSGVDLRKPDHLEKIRRVFKAANDARLPIVAHIATFETRKTEAAAKESSTIFLDQVLPVAPDIDIQLAHLAGSGSFDPINVAAFTVFADSISSRDARTKNLYFDISGGVIDKEAGARLVTAMRKVGLKRFLFGSDRSGTNNPPPAEAWKRFLQFPLTEDEFKQIAGNVMPWTK